eukprot:1930059-Rhodomonas_salina.1
MPLLRAPYALSGTDLCYAAPAGGRHEADVHGLPPLPLPFPLPLPLPLPVPVPLPPLAPYARARRCPALSVALTDFPEVRPAPYASVVLEFA